MKTDQKNENKAKRRPFHEEFAEKIIAHLEAGTAPWQRPWHPGKTISAPHNPASGTVYRGMNRVNLALSGYDDPRWMTLKQANDNGMSILPGSKSTPIVYYQFSEVRDRVDKDGNPVLGEDGKPQKQTVELDKPVVRFARVFNAEQIDGIPPLELTDKAFEWDPVEKAENILSASGANINHDQSDRAFYRYATDSIHLPPRENFEDPGRYYGTALHELGHWTRHSSRLDRESGPFGSEMYAREELRAEIASWMLGQDIGIPHDPGQHSAYVAGWIKTLKEDPYEIVRACRDAEQIKEYVMGLEQRKEIAREQTPEKAMEREEGIAAMSLPANPASEKVFINVPYAEKREAKALGAKWDRSEKSWFIPPGVDQTPFEKWQNTPLFEKLTELEAKAAPRPWGILDGSRSMDDIRLIVAMRNALPELLQKIQEQDPQRAELTELEAKAAPRPWHIDEGRSMDDIKLYVATRNALPELLQKIQERDLPGEFHAPEKQSMLTPQEEFAKALESAGLDLRGELPIMDGSIHRVPLIGRNELDGAYCGFLDGRPAGWMQNFSSGEKTKWVASGHALSKEQMEAQRAEMAQKQLERAEERRLAHEEAAQMSRAAWDMGNEAHEDHPYLKAKGVPPFGLKENWAGVLHIPVHNVDGELRGLQTINADGRKRFVPGMEKAGNFHLITEPGKDLSQGEIILAEGYSTGASLHLATNKPVAVAFDAGNLRSVAEKLREKFPNVAITICADNDHQHTRRTPDGRKELWNKGVALAEEAAEAVGGRVRVPIFNEKEKARGLTDYNDLHQSRGLEEVKKQLGLDMDRKKVREKGEGLSL